MIYYVDTKNGSNSNDGKSFSRPFKDLSPFNYSSVNQPLLKPKDLVLIKRDSVLQGHWKLWYHASLDSRADYITIGAYGVGENPRFTCSKIVNKKVFIPQGNNIYKLNLKDTNNFDGYQGVKNGLDCSVGSIYDAYNDKLYGNQLKTINELTEQFDFYNDKINGELYIYSTIDPFLISHKLHINVSPDNTSLLTATNNMIIENLTFANAGCHGVNATKVDGSYNIEIRNCKFLNLGGSELTSGDHSGVRFGNGIEIYEYGKQWFIHHNIFENCFDVATTIQGVNGYFEDITISNNVMIKNSQSFEVWTDGDISARTIGSKNIRFIHNVCLLQGCGFGNLNNRDNACDILMPNLTGEHDILISDNIFYNPYKSVYYLELFGNKNIKFRRNKIYIEKNKKIVYQLPYRGIKTDFEQYQLSFSNDFESKFFSYNVDDTKNIYENLLISNTLFFEEIITMFYNVNNLSSNANTIPIPSASSDSLFIGGGTTIISSRWSLSNRNVNVMVKFTTTRVIEPFTTLLISRSVETKPFMDFEIDAVFKGFKGTHETPFYIQNKTTLEANKTYELVFSYVSE